MADTAAIETVLKEIEASEGIEEALLVSRNGTYIAGSVPRGAHLETFAAMFAILLGAAENSTSELREVLDNVVINLESSKIVIVHSGNKALLVLRMAKAQDSAQVKSTMEKYIPRIEDNL